MRTRCLVLALMSLPSLAWTGSASAGPREGAPRQAEPMAANGPVLPATPGARGAPPRRIVFDAQMLSLGAGGRAIDTSRFERGNVIEPGRYRLDLLVNNQWRGVEDVELRREPGQDSAVLCYDRRLLERAGIDLARSARGQDGVSGGVPLPEGLACEPLARHVPGATSRLDIAEQAIYLSVPEFYLSLASSKTYVDPSSWDNGISAALLNYNASLYNTDTRGRSDTSGYAGLNAGLNLGRLRLRHNGTATWSRRNGSHYQRSATYGQTDLPAWRSQLLVGESSTSSEFFDPVSFRGARLSSDDRMLPDSLRYYAPVVRGTANTNARVSVYQRGYLIYETTVAPGAFALDELQAASFGGDLEVRVAEASGEVRTFIVPFATTVQLLRPGTTRYSLTAGQVNDPSLERRPNLVQGIYQRGLGNDLTAYGGGAFTGSYMSALLGLALNTPIGGFAGDVTLARTRYWSHGGRAVNFSVGYSNQWRDVSYTLSAQRLRSQYEGFSDRERGGASSTLFSLSVSIPLGGPGRGSPTLSSYLTHDSASGTQLTSGVSGLLGRRDELSYALSASHDRERGETSKNASLDYRLPQVELGSSLSQGPGYRQVSLKASGGLVAHAGGLTATQMLGETIALVHAADALGARAGYAGNRVDRSGYAVVPNLIPYQSNSIDLDPLGMPEAVELKASSRNVAPTAGAVVRLEYPTRIARPLLVDSRMPSGEPLPFAAEVVDAQSGENVGAVGQGSRLVLRVERERGTLRVRWGDAPDQQCLLDYALPARAQTSTVLKLACRPVAGGLRS